MPAGCEYLWDWYGKLRGRAGGTGFGPSPLTPRLILDWDELYRLGMIREEIDLLIEIDDAFMGAATKRARDERDRKAREREQRQKGR